MDLWYASSDHQAVTGEEVERLRKACGDRLGHHAHRDGTMILVAYRPSQRASELAALREETVDIGMPAAA